MNKQDILKTIHAVGFCVCVLSITLSRQLIELGIHPFAADVLLFLSLLSVVASFISNIFIDKK